MVRSAGFRCEFTQNAIPEQLQGAPGICIDQSAKRKNNNSLCMKVASAVTDPQENEPQEMVGKHRKRREDERAAHEKRCWWPGVQQKRNRHRAVVKYNPQEGDDVRTDPQ